MGKKMTNKIGLLVILLSSTLFNLIASILISIGIENFKVVGNISLCVNVLCLCLGLAMLYMYYKLKPNNEFVSTDNVDSAKAVEFDE
jgi:hypothetical protein